jgi:hypothetical protein
MRVFIGAGIFGAQSKLFYAHNKPAGLFYKYLFPDFKALQKIKYFRQKENTFGGHLAGKIRPRLSLAT